MSLLILILLVLLLVGALPTWGYSGNWGYGPSGLLGLILVIVLVFALLGRI
jgi:hypothetical protein